MSTIDYIKKEIKKEFRIACGKRIEKMIRILNSKNITKKEILCRVETPANVDGAVDEVLANVRENGDKALLEYTKKLGLGIGIVGLWQ